MRTAVLLGVLLAPPPDTEPEPEPSSTRAYGGVIEAPSAEAVDVPSTWWRGDDAASGPRRPTVADVFVNPDAPRAPTGAGTAGAPPSTRPTRVAATRAPGERRIRTGLGLLVGGGVVGSLAALSRLPVMIVGDTHVRCLSDPSRYGLAPCEEQAVGHRATFSTSSVLLAAAVPMLGVGGFRRGRYVTEHRRGGRVLREDRSRRRLGAGIGLAVLGAGGLAASYPLGSQVAFGSCTKRCRARFVAAEVTWWGGASAVASGVLLITHTLGRRTKPAGRAPKVALVPGPAVGATVASRF